MPGPYRLDDWHDALGVALREARLAAGLTQERLAEKVTKPGAPAHRNYVGGVERGERRPTVKFMVRVVNELDGDLVGLFCRAGELLESADMDAARNRADGRRAPLHYPGVER